MRRHGWTVTVAFCGTMLGCGDGTGPDLAEIVVEPATLTLAQQESERLVPSVLDGQGRLVTGVAVTFNTSNASIVTVDATGLVHSAGPAGSATVTVRAGQLTKAVPVTVTAAATTISVTPSPGVLPQLSTLQLDAKLLDLVGDPIPGAPLTFTSSNSAVLTVSATGLVTSVGPAGQANVIVTSTTLSAHTAIAVTQVAHSLVVSPNPVRLGQQGPIQVNVNVLDAVGAEIPGLPATFAAAPASLLTISSTGLLAAVGPLGSGTVTVNSAGLSREVPVTVVEVSHPVGTVVATKVIGTSLYGAAVSAGGQVYVVGLNGDFLRTTLPSFDLASLPSLLGPANAAVFSPSGNRLFVSGAPSDGVTEVVAATGAVAGSVTGLSGRPFDIVMARDGSRLYVSTENGVVYVIDPATRTIVGQVQAAGTGVVHLALHPSLPLLYASAPDGIQVTEIDLQDLSTRPLSIDGRPQALAVSPDGSELYVADETGNLSIVTLSNDVVVDIPIGCSGYGLALTPDGLQVYVSCSIEGFVKVVDVATRSVIKTIAVNGNPRRVAVSPDGFTVVVPNEFGWVDFIQ